MNTLTPMEPMVAFDDDFSKPTEAEIARLAYQLWQDRGSPTGSADEDWYLAEAELRNRQADYIATL